MRMQNAEMEFVTFDAQDVIATSTFTLSGYVNGSPNDVVVFSPLYGNLTTEEQVRNAFGAKYADGIKFACEMPGSTGGVYTDYLLNSGDYVFAYDAIENGPFPGFEGGNGTYTYDATVGAWINENLQ